MATRLAQGQTSDLLSDFVAAEQTLGELAAERINYWAYRITLFYMDGITKPVLVLHGWRH